jgi:hypothetical protein
MMKFQAGADSTVPQSGPRLTAADVSISLVVLQKVVMTNSTPTLAVWTRRGETLVAKLIDNETP